MRLISKWSMLSSTKIAFHYHIGEYKYCHMSSEDDWFAMQLLVEQFNPSRIDIDVLSNNQSSGSGNNRKSFENSGSKATGSVETKGSNSVNKEFENHLHVEEELFPVYDVCPPIEKASRPSCVWSSNIQRAGQKFLGGTEEFRQELSKYASIRGFKYCFIKNNKSAVSVYCEKRDITQCGWKISGTCKKYDPSFTINHAQLEKKEEA